MNTQVSEHWPTYERLLRVLVGGPASGFEVSRGLRDNASTMHGGARSIYVTLHRLEHAGLVEASWSRLRDRRFEERRYHVTARGLRVVAQQNGDLRPEIHPLTVLMVVAMCGAWTGTAHARAVTPRMTLVVRSLAPIAPEVLLRATREVNRVLGAAGITVEWILQASPSTPAPPIDGYVAHADLLMSLNRVSTSTGEIVLGLTSRANDQLGEADMVLFVDHILEFASAEQKDVSRVLGLVIAHEIGHALLQSSAHADAGIMQAPWDRHALDQADDGSLLFTARQSAQMRERLTHCCEQAGRN